MDVRNACLNSICVWMSEKNTHTHGARRLHFLGALNTRGTRYNVMYVRSTRGMNVNGDRLMCTGRAGRERFGGKLGSVVTCGDTEQCSI